MLSLHKPTRKIILALLFTISFLLDFWVYDTMGQVNDIDIPLGTTTFVSPTVTISYSCRNEDGNAVISVDLLSYEEGREVSIEAGFTQFFATATYNGSPIHFSIPDPDQAEWVAVWSEYGWEGLVDINVPKPNCNVQTATYIPHTSCIDVSIDVISEQVGVDLSVYEYAEIDGDTYPINGNFYWVIPEGVEWVWEVYIGGIHVLTLSSDGTNCSIKYHTQESLL